MTRKFSDTNKRGSRSTLTLSDVLCSPLLRKTTHIVGELKTRNVRTRPTQRNPSQVILLATPNTVRTITDNIARLPRGPYHVARLHPRPEQRSKITTHGNSPKRHVNRQPTGLKTKGTLGHLFSPPVTNSTRRRTPSYHLNYRQEKYQDIAGNLRRNVRTLNLLNAYHRGVMNEGYVEHFNLRPPGHLGLIYRRLRRRPHVRFQIIRVPNLRAPVLVVLRRVVMEIAQRNRQIRPRHVGQNTNRVHRTQPHDHRVQRIVPGSVVPSRVVNVKGSNLGLIRRQLSTKTSQSRPLPQSVPRHHRYGCLYYTQVSLRISQRTANRGCIM